MHDGPERRDRDAAARAESTTRPEEQWSTRQRMRHGHNEAKREQRRDHARGSCVGSCLRGSVSVAFPYPLQLCCPRDDRGVLTGTGSRCLVVVLLRPLHAVNPVLTPCRRRPLLGPRAERARIAVSHTANDGGATAQLRDPLSAAPRHCRRERVGGGLRRLSRTARSERRAVRSESDRRRRGSAPSESTHLTHATALNIQTPRILRLPAPHSCAAADSLADSDLTRSSLRVASRHHGHRLCSTRVPVRGHHGNGIVHHDEGQQRSHRQSRGRGRGS